nr:MAG TPA: hypothetical protein [Caudoviricetes sp.]
MPAVFPKGPSGRLFVFFAVSDSEIFYVTFWKLFYFIVMTTPS